MMIVPRDPELPEIENEGSEEEAETSKAEGAWL